MNLYVVLIYTHKAELQPLFERQLAKAGIETLHYIDGDFSWRRLQLQTMEIAKDHPDDLLVFPDAWDTVLLGSKNELLDLHLEEGITLAGAKNCWPDFDKGPQFYAKTKTRSPWKFLNANPMAGLGKNILQAMEWGWERFPLTGDSRSVLTPDKEVPERFFTNLYLQAPTEFNIKIDTECRMNQVTMSWFPEDYKIERGRIYNPITKSWPVFLHVNGTHTLPEGLEL